jgi:hypothetical protein
MISATLKRAREAEEFKSTINELAKRQAQETSPGERFKSFFGALANATPAAAATPSRLRQLLSGSSSTPTATSTPQRASTAQINLITTPRSGSLRPNPSPSPSSVRQPPSSFTSSSWTADATPTRAPINANKENARNACSATGSVTSDNRMAVVNQQLQAAAQASATLQKQVATCTHILKHNR